MPKSKKPALKAEAKKEKTKSEVSVSSHSKEIKKDERPRKVFNNFYSTHFDLTYNSRSSMWKICKPPFKSHGTFGLQCKWEDMDSAEHNRKPKQLHWTYARSRNQVVSLKKPQIIYAKYRSDHLLPRLEELIASCRSMLEFNEMNPAKELELLPLKLGENPFATPCPLPLIAGRGISWSSMSNVDAELEKDCMEPKIVNLIMQMAGNPKKYMIEWKNSKCIISLTNPHSQHASMVSVQFKHHKNVIYYCPPDCLKLCEAITDAHTWDKQAEAIAALQVWAAIHPKVLIPIVDIRLAKHFRDCGTAEFHEHPTDSKTQFGIKGKSGPKDGSKKKRKHEGELAKARKSGEQAYVAGNQIKE